MKLLLDLTHPFSANISNSSGSEKFEQPSCMTMFANDDNLPDQTAHEQADYALTLAA